MADIHPIRPDTATDAAYSKGDVIADGGGCWWQRDETRPGQVAWARFGEIRLHRLDDIPEPHTLIARHGETTDLVRARQTAIALMEENTELRRELASQRRRFGYLAEVVSDGLSDIDITLRQTDPLRDDS